MTRFLQRFALVFALLGAGTVAGVRRRLAADNTSRSSRPTIGLRRGGPGLRQDLRHHGVYEKSAPMMAKAMAAN